MTDQRLDTFGMFDAMVHTPEQIVSMVETSQDLEGLPKAEEIDNILVLGVGDSGTAGDLLASTAGPFMPVPVVTVKNYNPPSYVNDRTLVFAVSFSGNTPETIEAATAAAETGGRIVAVTSGGKLAKLAEEWGAVHVPVDPDLPSPRAAFASLAVGPLIVLEDVGLFGGATQWLIHAVEQLRRRRNALVMADSVAKEIAQLIDGTAPLMQGGGGIGSVAADRWKTQINANAKLPAFSSALPNLGHNEIEGWGRVDHRTTELLSLVQLRHEHEHPLVQRGFDAVNAMVGDSVASVTPVHAEGEGPVAQMFDLMMLGDAVSLELAAIANVDPGPSPAIDELEERLRSG